MTCDHVRVLDLAKEGQWDEAHRLVQPYSDKQSCLIHGYLHRVEGDLGNAKYWYQRADEKMPDNTLAEELERLYENLR
jgi:hypothetical protein